MDVMTCPSCQQEIYAGAEVCPLCGESKLRSSPALSPTEITLIAITLGALLLFIGQLVRNYYSQN